MRVPRQEQDLQAVFEDLRLLFRLRHLLFRHCSVVGILILQQAFGGGDAPDCLAVMAKAGDDGIQLSVFAAQGAETVRVVVQVRVGEQAGDFFEAVRQGLEFGSNARFHNSLGSFN